MFYTKKLLGVFCSDKINLKTVNHTMKIMHIPLLILLLDISVFYFSSAKTLPMRFSYSSFSWMSSYSQFAPPPPLSLSVASRSTLDCDHKHCLWALALIEEAVKRLLRNLKYCLVERAKLKQKYAFQQKFFKVKCSFIWFSLTFSLLVFP